MPQHNWRFSAVSLLRRRGFRHKTGVNCLTGLHSQTLGSTVACLPPNKQRPLADNWVASGSGSNDSFESKKCGIFCQMCEAPDPAKLILGNRPQQSARDKLSRLDILSHLYIFFILIATVVAGIIGLCYLEKGHPRVGVPLLIAVAAFLTYGFNTTIQRRVRVGENTSGVLEMLRGRWDELRSDETLSQIFSGKKANLTDIERVKLRFFLYTLFDVYEYAIHLIYHGYFPHAESLAVQYKNLIRKTLTYPHVISIWEETNESEEKTFQNEYSSQLRDVVNAIAYDLRDEGNL